MTVHLLLLVSSRYFDEVSEGPASQSKAVTKGGFMQKYSTYSKIIAHPFSLRLRDSDDPADAANSAKAKPDSPDDDNFSDVSGAEDEDPSLEDGALDVTASSFNGAVQLAPDADDGSPGGASHRKWFNELVPRKPPDELLADSSKLQVVIRLLELAVERGEKTVVFTQWTTVIELISRRLQASGLARVGTPAKPLTDGKDFVCLHGQTKSRDRQRVAAVFNKPDSALNIIIASVKAIGIGINLTGASRVIIFDHTFNPTWEMQAIGRAYRYGQDKPVTVYRLISDRTMEQKVYTRQCNKVAMFKRCLDNDNMARMFNDGTSDVRLEQLDNAGDTEDDEDDSDSDFDDPVAPGTHTDSPSTDALRIEKSIEEEAGIQFKSRDELPHDAMLASLLDRSDGVPFVKRYHTQDQALEKLDDEHLTDQEKLDAERDAETALEPEAETATATATATKAADPEASKADQSGMGLVPNGDATAASAGVLLSRDDDSEAGSYALDHSRKNIGGSDATTVLEKLEDPSVPLGATAVAEVEQYQSAGANAPNEETACRDPISPVMHMVLSSDDESYSSS